MTNKLWHVLRRAQHAWLKIMIKNIAIASIITCITLIIVVQNDGLVKQRCAMHLQKVFEQTYGATCQLTVDSIDFFSLSGECVDVTVAPCEGTAWMWQAKRLLVHASWWDLLMYGVINIHLVFEGFYGSSVQQDGSVPLFQHMQRYRHATESVLPIALKSISLKPACVMICDQSTGLTSSLKWHSELKLGAHGFKSNVYCIEGSLSGAHGHYCDAITGMITTESDGGTGYIGTVKGSCQLYYGPDQKETLFIVGSWDGTNGTVRVKNADQSIECAITEMQSTHQGIQASIFAHAPVADLIKIIGSTVPMTGVAQVQGSCIGNWSGIVSADAVCTINECQVSDFWHPHTVTTTVRADGADCSGNITFADVANEYYARGAWQGNVTSGCLRCGISSTQALSVPGKPQWSIMPENVRVRVDRDESGVWSGLYGVYIDDVVTKEQIGIMGTGSRHDDTIECSGHINNHQYAGSFSLTEAPYITSLTYVDSAGKKQIDGAVSAENPHQFCLSATVEGLNTMVTACGGPRLDGQGSMQINVTCADDIALDICFADGLIRIPHLYNVMKEVTAHVGIDVRQKKFTIDHTRCIFDRGEVTCNHGIVRFSDAYECISAYAPFLIHDCLFNMNKDLFALISGQLLCSYNKADNMPRITGSIILERAQLKENLFSQEFQKKLFAGLNTSVYHTKFNGECDISIETAAPIRLETGFLDTQVHGSLHVSNTLREPCLSGCVQLSGGTLYFPYKPLHITKGTLYFPPHQTYDPVIELVAKNKIKKYNVTLNVNGSLQNHTISLESSPPLTEEQIMALLLVGSHEDSLNIVMPALIMNNITSLLFGGIQTRDSLERSFRRLFKPFNNVHLVPSFTDQTGRGGLRGAIEVEVTDRLRALIQKNFSLSEDTRIEIEYLLSDDVSVRAIRNERRDVGGEVEMRWKF